MKIDHLVLNVSRKYQQDSKEIKVIQGAGFPYAPDKGTRTKGCKITNIWIGNEYLKLGRLLLPSGGHWKKEWVDAYNLGQRGLICLMLDTDNLDSEYNRLASLYVPVTKPEIVRYKWFLNLLSKTMPWRNSYIPLFFGVPLQLGFQEMKDISLRSTMEPNSRVNSIKGIKKIVMEGPFTEGDLKMLPLIFPDSKQESEGFTAKLENNQTLVFKVSKEYEVKVYTDCNLDTYRDKTIRIENVTIINR
jgi:hypothetical protein